MAWVTNKTLEDVKRSYKVSWRVDGRDGQDLQAKQ